MFPSFSRNKPRGALRRQIASSALSNLVSGSSTVGSASLSAVSSVLPSLTFEPTLKPVALYNAEREEEKHKSRRKSYSKLAKKEREELKKRQESYINAQAKKAAQKLMKKKQAKLAPINGSARTFSSIMNLLPSLEPITEPTTLFSNRMNVRRRERTKKAAAESRKGKNSSRRNLMVMPTKNGSRSRTSSSFNTLNDNASQEAGLLNGLNLSEIELIRDPNSRPTTLLNNYRPNGTRASKKHRNLLNAQRRNRGLYPNTYENNH